MQASFPIVLTIAGSDSGGGAGIQADLKSFCAREVYGASVITSITAQNTCAVRAVEDLSGALIKAQIDAVLDDLDVIAIKIGMLSSVEIIQVVSEALCGFSGPVVLDPVMVAKSGDRLLQDSAVKALTIHLLPKATLLTPNLPEAATLLGCAVAKTEADMLEQAKALFNFGVKAVLMKGGHGVEAHCVDLLVQRKQRDVVTRLSATRINTKNTHGTGCTLSASIAAELAKGCDMVSAVRRAHTYLQSAIAMADQLNVGKGHGPVHHFHALWSS